MGKKIKDNYEIFVSLFLFILLCSISLNVETTGDSGDSILHYLYSKYSFSYPEFFLNHWAKPLFVLLSSPFSQFGFKGMVVFNCLVVSLTGLFTFWTAKNLNLKYPWIVFVLILFCPLFFKLLFSGLTEYLFGLLLIIPVYLITKNKYLPAVIIASFLPFVRSEGLIVLGVLLLFLLAVKRYKAIPWLLIGHVLYSIAGFFYYDDLLWVFTKIPYNNLGSPYGHGEMFDFVHRLNYVIEKPIYLLLFVGFISVFYNLFRKRSEVRSEILLVCGIFLAVFISHSLFWFFGVFNSMGLPRVLIVVVPQIALIALMGFEFLADKLRPSLSKYIVPVILAVILIFPFTSRPQGVVFNKDLFRIPENELFEKEVVPHLKQKLAIGEDQLFYYSSPYISLSLDLDHFNTDKHRNIEALSKEVPPAGAIVIWENWYSVVEGGISLEQLKSNPNLTLIGEFERQEENGLVKFVLFTSSSTSPASTPTSLQLPFSGPQKKPSQNRSLPG